VGGVVSTWVVVEVFALSQPSTLVLVHLKGFTLRTIVHKSALLLAVLGRGSECLSERGVTYVDSVGIDNNLLALVSLVLGSVDWLQVQLQSRGGVIHQSDFLNNLFD
jgi:hypothetical protein